MLTVSQEQLDRLESQYPGITEQIRSVDSANLPSCPKCKSTDTASVQVGVIGRSMNIACATTKVKLAANGRPGKYFCNDCESYFD